MYTMEYSAEEMAEDEYREHMYRVANNPDYEALMCLEQMVHDNFNCEPYSLWSTNEECITDAIRSIVGRGTLQKRCSRIRAAWAEHY
jgi:hypothetical protein